MSDFNVISDTHKSRVHTIFARKLKKFSLDKPKEKGINQMGIQKVFSKIGGFFVDIWQFFNKDEVKKVKETIKKFTPYVLPVVKMIASATPNKIDDALIIAGESIGRSAIDIITSTDDIIKDGGRQKLAAEVVKARFKEIIENVGEVKLGDIVLRTADEVDLLDKTLLLTAIQDTVALYKLTTKKTKE